MTQPPPPPLPALPPLPRAALFGFVEMTNGVNALPATRTGFVLCAAIMNWGGLSVQAQTRALLAGSARGAAAFLKGLAPRRGRGYTEGAAFAAPFTL